MKFKSITNPISKNLLISFMDLTNFTLISKRLSNQEVFYFLNEIYEITGKIIEKNSGRILKFIGDAALIVFEEDEVDNGVKALLEVKQEIDRYLEINSFKSQVIVKCHFGEVIIGLMGIKGDKRLDVVGENVNIAATIKSHGFAMSQQTFRKLDKETRKLFKKHTPTIRYISIDEKHRD